MTLPGVYFTRNSIFLLGAVAAVMANRAPAYAEGAVVAGHFGDWALHISEGASHKICFAATEPKQKEPAVANRATALLYISAWPKEGVKSEFSVKLGYPVKAQSATVSVGKDTFKLLVKEERAYVSDATEELKLIEAMKKGSDIVVRATSERGTATTDTYSLSGISQALKALETACP